MINSSDVRQHLALVASGEFSLDAFEDWLAQASWNMHRDSAEDAMALVSSIHSLFALRDDRAIDINGLRRELLALLGEPVRNRPVALWESVNGSSPARFSLSINYQPAGRIMAVALPQLQWVVREVAEL